MQRNVCQKNLIGIVGGMGPLSSSAFIETIYQMHAGNIEQDSPKLILYSDATIPDRTEAFLNGEDDLVLEPFVRILQILKDLQVAKIVVCCITIHYLFKRLPEDVRGLIVSLVDTIFFEVLQVKKKHLLLCTNGTLRMRLFQNHPLWEKCKDYILVPAEQDQQIIHELIYRIKANYEIEQIVDDFEELFKKYQIDSFIAGCTEIHLLVRYLVFKRNQRKHYDCIDPLMTIAKKSVEERL